MQYSRAELLMAANNIYCTLDKNKWNFIPLEIRHYPAGANIIITQLNWHRRWRHRKSGKTARLAAVLKANPHKHAIPSVFLTNFRSLNKKMDKL